MRDFFSLIWPSIFAAVCKAESWRSVLKMLNSLSSCPKAGTFQAEAICTQMRLTFRGEDWTRIPSFHLTSVKGGSGPSIAAIAHLPRLTNFRHAVVKLLQFTHASL